MKIQEYSIPEPCFTCPISELFDLLAEKFVSFARGLGRWVLASPQYYYACRVMLACKLGWHACFEICLFILPKLHLRCDEVIGLPQECISIPSYDSTFVICI